MLVLRSCVIVPIHSRGEEILNDDFEIRQQRQHLGARERQFGIAHRHELMPERVDTIAVHRGHRAFGADAS